MNDVIAIILAAGKGTRLKSGLPKVLHPLLGHPLLAYPLDACRAAGIGRHVVVTGYGAEAVEASFTTDDVTFVLQAEQNGTGHAVAVTRGALEGVGGTALILCGDVPLVRSDTLSALVDAHRVVGARATVLTMHLDDPTGYGRLVRDDAGRPARIVEHRDATPDERAVGEVNTGTYAVDLPWLWDALDRLTPENDQGEYYLTDIIARAAAEGRAEAVCLEDPDEALGINDRAQLAEAAGILRSRINEAWMAEGVTLEDPYTAWIEPGVELAPDVTVGPNVRLEGETRVERGARIDTGCVVTDSAVGAGAHLKPYSVIEESRVGPDTQVGPFAHLRPGAVMEEGAKIGNFVEMKKSVLGRGSKASHLTYLGDTVVGEGANIGAGTITCNYDGAFKHATVIGDRAFVGSNTSLVAPVTVGADATVAAGSVITRSIPADALGVARGKQRNVNGWSAKRPVKP